MRNIAIQKMASSRTGINIVQCLRKLLHTHHISIDQIYSMTTNNGRNMIKAVQIMQLYQSHLLDDFLHDDENENHLNSLINEVITNRRQQLNSGDYLLGIHCAAHTIELAVNESIIASKEVNNLINTSRDLVKKMKTEKIFTLIKATELARPILDCPTRCNSTFVMVSK